MVDDKKKLNLCCFMCFSECFDMFNPLKDCSAHSVLTPWISLRYGNDGWYLHKGLSGGMQQGSACSATWNTSNISNDKHKIFCTKITY